MNDQPRLVRITTRMHQTVDYGKHKGSQPVRVSKRAVVAEITGESNAREQLTAAGLPRDGAPPIAWARFLHSSVPVLRRDGWNFEVDSSVNDLVLDASSAHAIWDMRLESRAHDWFDVDMGVQIDGHRVPLLPLIVDVLRGMQGGVIPQGGLAYAAAGDRVVVLPVERIRNVLQTLVELHDDPHLTARGRLTLSRLSALEIAKRR